ncbi:type I restriction endonuclease subunit R [Thiothrix unzii]|uniref:Type I restriction enzyme endonuclease subunit n=1 Tax=Thiothrix unzii TaxID=111769 RepID=A0A975IGV1_9GAMM|nr:type I restriction endonuclease subunit R [Thiothrix unzii]QTR53089.1 type I restriction endonuclease subunit R [Thiothrix unzii]
MSRFTEAKLEQAIITLLGEQGYPHVRGDTLTRTPQDVLLQDELRAYLQNRYAHEGITAGEIEQIIRHLEALPASDLYDSNKTVMKLVCDGFLLKREDRSQKDLYIQLIDYSDLVGADLRVCPPSNVTAQREEGAHIGAPLREEMAIAEGFQPRYRASKNRYQLVNQLEIEGYEKRIPDAILYINGLPLVVFEFKSAVREDATIHDAYVQLTTRYRRDIPELLKYNALCVISDGVNSKVGSLFARYEFFYAWRKVTGDENLAVDGISSLHTLIQGLFDKRRLRDVIRNFIYLPDTSRKEEKVVCRYPQYYAATKLYAHILTHRKPHGDGKGGTYFGATGCGKSYTMLFLARLLMRSVELASPTIVLITDRTDLDDQLSGQFVKAKSYIGDDNIISVESRTQLRELLKGRTSGGVFLTTIHKFTEDIELLSERNNIICISDEAHRSQINLDQKVRVTEQGVKRTFGFAKYLHDSLPNATYVGFTGTPVDATLEVFGRIVDSYTMTESVKDDITVRIVYEGRAAKVILDNQKLKDIEAYYQQCAEDGASDYQIEESKKASANMSAILGDPDRLKALAADFVAHYENRVAEGATLKGKAMFVCSKREIAWDFYQQIIALRPEWAEVREPVGADLRVCPSSESGDLGQGQTRRSAPTRINDIKPSEHLKLVMTRGQDDPKALYDLLGTKEYRKELDRQFKEAKSNFKIAIVVDMWLTGFDVPELDTIYIDKPIQRHSLIQTISRVNRTIAGKNKGLVVDYIGIKRQMNEALKQYSKGDEDNFEEIQQSIIAVKDQLDLLDKLFYPFFQSDTEKGQTHRSAPTRNGGSIVGAHLRVRPDFTRYFYSTPVEQLTYLNLAAEFVQLTQKLEQRFMGLVKRLKAAYDICSGSDAFTQSDRDRIHFYLAVRSIVFKLTRGNAPDTAQMNAKVREMIKDALQSDGVEEIFKLGEDATAEVDLFSDDYLAKIDKIKLPNTKIKLLQQLLERAIAEFKKTNRAKGVDFSKQFKALVDRYNERDEQNVLVSNVLDDFANEIIDLFHALQREKASFADLGIDFEEKAFYDILKGLAVKYDFTYPEAKLLTLAQAVKAVVDDKSKYTDWNQREDIKAELKVDLIMLLAKYGYPPVDRDEVYKEIFAQAENFKQYRNSA